MGELTKWFQADKVPGLLRRAVIVSVGVTLLTAAWQVRVATVMDRDNSTEQRQAQTQLLKQLKAQQEVLKQQLTVQQEQFRQQARDAEELRRQLNRARQRPDAPAALVW